MAVALFAENLDKRGSSANGTQKRKTPIASESNEMKMAVPVMASELVGHGKKEKSKPRPSKRERVGHPEGQRLRKIQKPVPRG